VTGGKLVVLGFDSKRTWNQSLSAARERPIHSK
jgi:hypothetical protein